MEKNKKLLFEKTATRGEKGGDSSRPRKSEGSKSDALN